MPSTKDQAALRARFQELQRAGKRLPLERLGGYLGKMPDADIAALAGVSGETVRRWREERKIPAQRVETNWTPARLKILMDNDNETAARLLKVSVAACKTRRSRLNKESGK